MNNKIPNAFEYYFEKIGGYADTEESYNVIKEKRYHINYISHLYKGVNILKSLQSGEVNA